MAGTDLILRRRAYRALRHLCCVVVLLAVSVAAVASDYRGLVSFGGVAVPGATVTVTQGGKKFVTVTDMQGFYSFPALADGAATVEIQMTGFSTVEQAVTIAPDGALRKWELKLLSLDAMRSELKPVPSAGIAVAQVRSEPKKTGEAPKPQGEQAAAAAPPPVIPDEVAQRASDGLLINGSVNNAATSQFSMAPRFGNTASGRSLYTFMLNLRLENSALDAKSYSLAGFDSPKPNTNQITGGFSLQGPLKIPHLLHHGPNLFIGYQRTRNSFATATPGLMPDLALRSGDFSKAADSLGQTIYAPLTGLSPGCLAAGVTPGAPFAGNIVPAACISSQAQALLKLYPLPNFFGNAQYNYQIPLITDLHSDALTSNVNKTIGRNNQLAGTFAVTSTRGSNTTLFDFVDATRGLGISTTVTWSHTFNAHLRANLGYTFSRQSSRMTPYWENRSNFSSNAGITGNNQDSMNWGPPALSFASAVTGLSDAQSYFNRNETNGITPVVTWNHGPHNVTIGVVFRRQEFNYLAQANPRGTFTFTGATTAGRAGGTGVDFADFLIGVPTTSALAYGNADKYLRQSVYAAYVNDDWRVNPQLTINAGLRWDYGSPATELKERLVNLDVASGFSAIAPVLASSPTGKLTGQSYPTSLMRPDYNGVEPQLGLSWRPIPGSSMVVAAGYGIRYDTSIYQGIAIQMAQQPFAAARRASACRTARLVR